MDSDVEPALDEQVEVVGLNEPVEGFESAADDGEGSDEDGKVADGLGAADEQPLRDEPVDGEHDYAWVRGTYPRRGPACDSRNYIV